MKYRINALEGTVREEYETARATLEGLADSGVGFDDKRLTGALEVMGFEEEKLYDTTAYVRRKEDITDVLTDYALEDKKKKESKFCLYRIPSQQDVNGWYIKNLDEMNGHMKNETRERAYTMMKVAMASVGIFASVYIYTGESNVILLVAANSCGFTAGVCFLLGSRTFQRQLAKNGPKALHYIADTPFEEAFEYNRTNHQRRIEKTHRYDPLLSEIIETVERTRANYLNNAVVEETSGQQKSIRIETEKPRIIDAEFSEVEAEQEMEAEEESAERSTKVRR